MSLHVPPVPLFAVHGDKETPAGWVRSRILFIDDDGNPWISGREPRTHPTTKEHHTGDKTIAPARSWPKFLGIEEGHDPDAFLPVAAGWRVVEGFCSPGDEPEFEGQIKDVAAWLIKNGELYPVTISDISGVLPCDSDDSENGALIRILGPSDPTPSQECIAAWASKDYKLKGYLERTKRRSGLGEEP